MRDATGFAPRFAHFPIVGPCPECAPMSLDFLFAPVESIDEFVSHLFDGAPLPVALLLAALLGLRHATDPDHLMAVTSLVAADGAGTRAAARLGAFWGLGHATTLLVAGLPLILLSATVPDWVGSRRRDAGRHRHRRARGARAAALVAPRPRPHATSRTACGTPRQAVAIGALHGLAGTGAVVLLLIAAIPDPLAACAALAAFAPLSAASMALCTSGFAWTLTRPAVQPLYNAFLLPLLGACGLAVRRRVRRVALTATANSGRRHGLPMLGGDAVPRPPRTRPRLRESVIARLLLTLVLALGAVGTFQYFVVGGRVADDLIREHAAVHAADTRALEHRAEAAAGDRYSSPLSEVSELLTALAERPDTVDVVVVDKDGSVLASPIAGQVGTYRSDPLLRQVARTGKPVAGMPDGKDRHAYIEPLSLLGRDVVFAEYRSSDALATGVAAFRRGLGLFVLLSLLIALPLFYVLGGRSVGALYRSALQRARRDGLTDLDNHRAFQDELARAVGESARYGTTVTLALLDIDDFKFENDRHGHQHGDRLLCELAALLRDSRAGDRAFRLGGDEFALLLAHTGEAEADVPLARIRTEVERRLSGVTTSIGFSATRRGPRAEHAVGPRRRRAARGQAPRRQRHRRRRRGRRQHPRGDDREGPRGARADRRGRRRRRVPADLGPRAARASSATRRSRGRARSSSSGPGEAFEIADSIGRGHELDAVCRRATLRARARAAEGRAAVPQRVAADARARRARGRQPRAGGARRGLRARAGRARDHRAHRRPQGDPHPRGRAAARARLHARARRRRRRQRRASRCCARSRSTSSRSTAPSSRPRSRTAARAPCCSRSWPSRARAARS